MTYRTPLHRAARLAASLLAAGLLAGIAALATTRGAPPTAASPAGAPRAQRPPQATPQAAPPTDAPRAEPTPPPEVTEADSSPAAIPPAEPPPRQGAPPDIPRDAGAAEGALPDGTTVFDDDVPGVANLDPGLLGALRRAARDSAGDGVALFVTSGWRSPAYQEQLLREAVATYGSEEEAARWVATPDTSPHVSGDAVDVGPAEARAWLSERGAAYGLCQIYRNEPWHYEMRPDAIEHGCPPMYADPTRDPRMRPETRRPDRPDDGGATWRSSR